MLKKSNRQKSFSLFRIDKFLNAETKIFKVKVPNFVILGIAAVIFLYIGTAGIVSVATPWWLGKGDAAQHIDYAYVLYKGDLPRYDEGLSYPKFEEFTEGKIYQRQTASNHPPLFYILHAPLIGPLMDHGYWKQAIALGRFLNIFLGVLCILALAWGGWLFGGSRKALFAISVPALGVLMHHFTSLNLNYANDVLLVLLTTLSFIASYFVIKNGPSKKNIIFITLVSLGGMATKAPFIVFLFLNLLSVVLGVILNSSENIYKRLIRGSIIAGGILAVVIFAIGWFYFMQNYRVTGNWTKSIPERVIIHQRMYKSFSFVITNSQLWGMFYKYFAANPFISTIISLLSLGGIFALFDRVRVRALFNKKNPLFLIALMMVIATLGITATQITHAVGYGGFYFRYFLPLLLPFALVLSYGLLEFRWTRGQLVFLASIGLITTTIISTVRSSAIIRVFPELLTTKNPLSRVLIASNENGIPSIIPLFLILILLLGMLSMATSLYFGSSSIKYKR